MDSTIVIFVAVFESADLDVSRFSGAHLSTAMGVTAVLALQRTTVAPLAVPAYRSSAVSFAVGG